MRKIQTTYVAEFKAAGNKLEIAILKQTNIVFVVILLCVRLNSHHHALLTATVRSIFTLFESSCIYE